MLESDLCRLSLILPPAVQFFTQSDLIRSAIPKQ